MERNGKKIFWLADNDMRPVRQMDYGVSTIGIDGCNNCRLVSYKTAEGTDFFRKGFAGRIIFSDINQRPLQFEMKNYGFTSAGAPVFTATAVVGPYDGANPVPNPLYKMVITRKIELHQGKAVITHTFFNPTSKAMDLDLRFNSFPASVGERFKTKDILIDGKYGNAVKENFYLYKAPKGPWAGKTVTVSASDEFLKDTLFLTPDSKFKGFFSWKERYTPRRTVEFLVKDTLAPGVTLEYTYTISYENRGDK